jgi:hypothetical protein
MAMCPQVPGIWGQGMEIFGHSQYGFVGRNHSKWHRLIRRGADSNSRPQYRCALKERQTGHFVQKAFECAKYIDGYGHT